MCFKKCTLCVCHKHHGETKKSINTTSHFRGKCITYVQQQLAVGLALSKQCATTVGKHKMFLPLKILTPQNCCWPFFHHHQSQSVGGWAELRLAKTGRKSSLYLKVDSIQTVSSFCNLAKIQAHSERQFFCHSLKKGPLKQQLHDVGPGVSLYLLHEDTGHP